MIIFLEQEYLLFYYFQDCSTKWSLKNTIRRLDLKDDDRARKSYGSLNYGPWRRAFGAMAPALFFRLELADAIVYKTTTAFVDFNFTFLILIIRKVKLKSTKAVVVL